jgi:hypothetical protein
METLLTSLDKIKDTSSVSKKAIMIFDRMHDMEVDSGDKTAPATMLREHAAKSGRTFVGSLTDL